MRLILNVVLILSSVVMIVFVLIQGRGSGIGMAFGGDSNVYRTKRGLEKILFRATIVLGVILFGAALANALI